MAKTVKKKEERIKLSDDDFNFDSELDIPEFNFDEPKIKNDREPVTKILGSIKDSAVDAFADNSFLRRMMREALPKELGEAADVVSTVDTSIKDLYGTAVKEIKPAMGSLSKSVDRLLPDTMKRTKGILKRIQDWSEEPKFSRYDKKEIEEKNLALNIADVFKFQMEEEAKQRAEDKSEDKIQESLDLIKHRDQQTTFNSINYNLSRLAQYQDKVTSAYQKKSLELQYRSYFLSTEALEESRTANVSLEANLKAIAKNTALPEYVKLKKSEALKELIRTKSMESLFHSTTKFFSDAVKNVKSVGKEAIDAAREGFSMGAEAADMVGDARDMHASMGLEGNVPTVKDMILSHGVKMGVQGFAMKMSGFLRDVITNAVGSGSKVNDLAYGFSNIPQTINKFANKRSYDESFIEGASKDVLGAMFKSAGPDTTLETDNYSISDKPAMYTELTSKSITEIIPGYLARIYREIQRLRTGEEDVDLTSYDFGSNKFVDSKTISKKTLDRLVNTSNKSDIKYRQDRLFREVNKDNTLSEDDIKNITVLMMRDRFDNFRGGLNDPDLLSEPETWSKYDETKQNAETIAAAFKKHLDKKENATPEERKQYTDKRNDIHFQINRLGNSIYNPMQDLQKLVNLNQYETVSSLGITKDDDKRLDINKLIDLYVKSSGDDGSSLPPVPPGSPIPPTPHTTPGSDEYVPTGGLGDSNQQTSQQPKTPSYRDRMSDNVKTTFSNLRDKVKNIIKPTATTPVPTQQTTHGTTTPPPATAPTAPSTPNTTPEQTNPTTSSFTNNLGATIIPSPSMTGLQQQVYNPDSVRFGNISASEPKSEVVPPSVSTTPIVSSIKEKISAIKDKAESYYNSDLANDIKERFSNIKQNIDEAIEEHKPAVITAATNIKDSINNKATDAVANITASPVVGKLMQHVPTISDKLTEAKTAVSDKVDTFKNKLEPHIPVVQKAMTDMKDRVQDRVDVIRERLSAPTTVESTESIESDVVDKFVSRMEQYLLELKNSVTTETKPTVQSLITPKTEQTKQEVPRLGYTTDTEQIAETPSNIRDSIVATVSRNVSGIVNNAKSQTPDTTAVLDRTVETISNKIEDIKTRLATIDISDDKIKNQVSTLIKSIESQIQKAKESVTEVITNNTSIHPIHNNQLIEPTSIRSSGIQSLHQTPHTPSNVEWKSTPTTNIKQLGYSNPKQDITDVVPRESITVIPAPKENINAVFDKLSQKIKEVQSAIQSKSTATKEELQPFTIPSVQTEETESKESSKISNALHSFTATIKDFFTRQPKEQIQTKQESLLSDSTDTKRIDSTNEILTRIENYLENKLTPILIEGKGTGKDSFLSNLKGVVTKGFGGLRKVTKPINNVVLGTGLFAAKNSVKGVVGGLTAGSKAIGGTARFLHNKLRPYADVFVNGEEEPRLEAVKLKAGHYKDSSNGKVIKSIHELPNVEGDIHDENGDTVLKTTEFKDTFIKQDTKAGVFTLGKTLFGRALGIMKFSGGLVPQGIKLATNVANKVFKLFFADCYDVFLKDKLDTPVLTKLIMQNNGYFSATSGKVITKVKDIDGPIKNAAGDFVLTQDQLKEGLVDKFNRPIAGTFTRVLRTGIGLAIGAAKLAFTTAKKVGGFLNKKIFGGLGQVGEVLQSMFETLSVGLGGKKSLDKLEQIRTILDERLPQRKKKVFGDADNSGYRDGSWQDMERDKDKNKDNKDSKDKDKPTDEKAKPNKGLLGSLLDSVKSLKDTVKSIGGIFGGDTADIGDMIPDGSGRSKTPDKPSKWSRLKGFLGRNKGKLALGTLAAGTAYAATRPSDKSAEKSTEENATPEDKTNYGNSLLAAGATGAAGYGAYRAYKGLKGNNTNTPDIPTIPTQPDSPTNTPTPHTTPTGVPNTPEATKPKTKWEKTKDFFKGGLDKAKATGIKGIASKGLGMGLKGLGLAGAAYGAYSAYDNVKKGNYGEAAMDAGMAGLGLAGTGTMIGGATSALAGGTTAAALGTTAATATAATAGAGATIGGITGGAGGAGLLAAMGPVGWGVLGVLAAGAAGYAIYKYVSKPNMKPLSKMRMAQYGFTADDTDLIKKVQNFEVFLLDYIKYEDNIATLNDKDLKTKDALAFFGVKEKHTSKKEAKQLENWKQWYIARFKPIFLSHLTALEGLKNLDGAKATKITDVDEMRPNVKYKYLDMVRIESGPYDDHTSPFPDKDFLESGSRMVKYLTDIAEKEIKEEMEKNISKDPESNESLESKEILVETGDSKSIKAKKDPTFLESTWNSYKSFQKTAYDIVTSPARLGIAIGSSVKEAVVSFVGKNILKPLGYSVSALEAVRFKAYGLIEMDRSKVVAIRTLEKELLKDIKYKDETQAIWEGDLIATFKAISSEFGISIDDISGTDNWNTWFTKRFLPVYLYYLGLLRSCKSDGNKERAEAALKPEDKLDIAKKLITTDGVWSINATPWVNYKLNTDSTTTKPNIQVLEDESAKAKLAEEKSNKDKKTKPPGQSTLGDVIGDKKNDLVEKQRRTEQWNKEAAERKESGDRMRRIMRGEEEPNKPSLDPSPDGDKTPEIQAVVPGSNIKATKFDGFGPEIDTYIRSAAQKYGIDEKVMRGLVKMEAGWKGAVSYTDCIGVGQFTYSTWNDLAKTPEGKEIGMVPITSATRNKDTDPRKDNKINTLATALLARRNAIILDKIGAPVTGENLYMMHNIGAGVAPTLAGKPTTNPEVIKGMKINAVGMKGGFTGPSQFLEWQKNNFLTHYASANAVTPQVDPNIIQTSFNPTPSPTAVTGNVAASTTPPKPATSTQTAAAKQAEVSNTGTAAMLRKMDNEKEATQTATAKTTDTKQPTTSTATAVATVKPVEPVVPPEKTKQNNYLLADNKFKSKENITTVAYEQPKAPVQDTVVPTEKARSTPKEVFESAIRPVSLNTNVKPIDKTEIIMQSNNRDMVGSLSTINNTLSQSLDVQTKMLSALSDIVGKIDGKTLETILLNVASKVRSNVEQTLTQQTPETTKPTQTPPRDVIKELPRVPIRMSRSTV